jgi:hypothetical protein
MNPQSTQPEVYTRPFLWQPDEDYDQPYTWGRPTSTYLSFRQTVRLSILRSRLRSDDERWKEVTGDR